LVLSVQAISPECPLLDDDEEHGNENQDVDSRR
jgi:hypothetical protein